MDFNSFYISGNMNDSPLQTVPVLESWKPPNTNVRPPVYRPRSTGGFPLALGSPVMTNCPQVGVVKVT